MTKILIALLLGSLSLFASATTTEAIPDITMTWVGFTALFIFLVGYYVVAAEEKYGIDKASGLQTTPSGEVVSTKSSGVKSGAELFGTE